jgi:DNA-binding winged helix-turn-helix (wHTH) protein
LAETKSGSNSRVLRFGVFQINIAAQELRKHGVRVRLPGQPFCILSMLLEKPGEILTREEIRQRLWASDTFVDFEHSMNSAIKKLRAALSDTPENSRYIETIPRLGYRFIAPIEEIRVALPFSGDETVVSGTALPSGAKMKGKRDWKALLAIAILLAIAAGIYFKWSQSQIQPRLESKSAGEAHGIESSTKANVQPVSPAKAAEAHDLYLKGMYFWNQRTVAGFQQAIEYFQAATAKDPNYATAYAGLANSYTLLTAYSSVSANLYVPQARAAALRALQIDQGSAEGHTALALILQNHDWDWQTSEKEYRRAIELNPNYATAHHWYAEHLMYLGRFDEALRESEKARQLDPLSLIIAADYAAILYFSRQYDRAIEQFHAVLRKNPSFHTGNIVIYACVENGMFAQALAEAEKLRPRFGEAPGTGRRWLTSMADRASWSGHGANWRDWKN